MLFNILGIICGPLMMKTGITILEIVGLIWTILAAAGLLWFAIAFISSTFRD